MNTFTITMKKQVVKATNRKLESEWTMLSDKDYKYMTSNKFPFDVSTINDDFSEFNYQGWARRLDAEGHRLVELAAYYKNRDAVLMHKYVDDLKTLATRHPEWVV